MPPMGPQYRSSLYSDTACNFMYSNHPRIVSNLFIAFFYLFCHCLQLLSVGLNQKIIGSLLGDIKLSLVTGEGSYDITGDTGTASIGGKKQLFHCIT